MNDIDLLMLLAVSALVATTLLLAPGVILAAIKSILSARNGSAQAQGLSLDRLYKMFDDCTRARERDQARINRLSHAVSSGSVQLRDAIASGNRVQVERVMLLLDEAMHV